MVRLTHAVRRHICAGIVALALGAAAAGSSVASVLARERITTELWLEAQAHAARLMGATSYDAHSIHIEMAPIERVRQIAGDRAAHACVFARDWRVLYCRDDRPWQSERGHHFGIIIHEAAHSLQPDSMSPGCREVQAHRIQVAWLLKRGEAERAAEVARNAERYVCEEIVR